MLPYGCVMFFGAVFGLEKPRFECTRLLPTGAVQCQV